MSYQIQYLFSLGKSDSCIENVYIYLYISYFKILSVLSAFWHLHNYVYIFIYMNLITETTFSLQLHLMYQSFKIFLLRFYLFLSYFHFLFILTQKVTYFLVQ